MPVAATQGSAVRGASEPLNREPPAATPPGAWWEGFTTPLAGLRYMKAHPSLWRYGVIPLIVNLLATLTVLGLLIAAGLGFLWYLHPLFDGGPWWRVLEAVVAVVVLGLAVVLAMAAHILLQGAVCGHYYAKLAAEMERQLGIDESELQSVPFTFQMYDSLRDLTLLVSVNLMLLSLNILPGVGSVLALLGSLYWDGFVLGKDYLDHPLNVRGWRARERRAFARRHRWHTVGLGHAVMLVTPIPLASSILLTTAAAGAVLLHRRLAKVDEEIATEATLDHASVTPRAIDTIAT